MKNFFTAFNPNTNLIDFPGTKGKDATGPGATDGTAYNALMVDDEWGRVQAIMDHAGLTPDDVTEEVGTAQIIPALQKGFGIPPGISVEWNLADDPGVTGHRALLLQGQGVLRDSYPDLDDAVYVGDGNNAAVAAGGGAFFRADDALGVTPNIAGDWLILPDARGVVSRGLDTGALIDPDGAGRFLGDLQVDAAQEHAHNLASDLGTNNTIVDDSGTGPSANGGSLGIAATLTQDRIQTTAPVSGIFDPPRLSAETRMYNRSTHFVIGY